MPAWGKMSALQVSQAVTDGQRPDLKHVRDAQVAHVTRECWAAKPDERSSAQVVVDTLERQLAEDLEYARNGLQAYPKHRNAVVREGWSPEPKPQSSEVRAAAQAQDPPAEQTEDAPHPVEEDKKKKAWASRAVVEPIQ